MSGFADKEKARTRKSVVSKIAGTEEQIKGQVSIETLENGKYMPVEPKKETKPKGRPPVNTETKKRVSLAVLPSLYEKVGKIAYVERLSISEITSRLLEEYVANNEDKINEYNNLKK